MLTRTYAAPPPKKRERDRGRTESRSRKNFKQTNDTPRERHLQADRLECIILRAHALFAAYPTSARWRRLCRLIRARSLATVRRLEEAKGLAPRGRT